MILDVLWRYVYQRSKADTLNTNCDV